MQNAAQIHLTTQPFNDSSITLRMNGFFLNYNSSKHFITCHHFLPIKIVEYNDVPVKIHTNSCWNEIILLDIDEKKENCIVHTNIMNKIPKNNETMTININMKRYELITTGYEFIPFNNGFDGILSPYIKATFIEPYADQITGLSGMPVFLESQGKSSIVGIFSKFNVNTGMCYIIPIYMAIKTMEKKDNKNIYTSSLQNIKKINSYYVKKDMIYHPTLKISIPLQTYFLIEGDIDIKHCIHYESEDKINIVEINLNPMIELILTNEEDIISDISVNPCVYQINTRLLILLGRINMDKRIFRTIFNKIISENLKTLNVDGNKIIF